MADVDFQQFADNTSASKSEEVRIALGIANAYRAALRRKDSLDKRKVMLWRLIKNEVEERARGQGDVSEFTSRLRGAETAASNAGSDTWYEDFGPSESEVVADLREQYPDYVDEDIEEETESSSGDGSNWWTASKFTQFGRRIKRVQMECEFFAELLIKWVFFDGKDLDSYRSHAVEHILGMKNEEGLNKVTHPCRFLRRFGVLGFSEQVGVIDKLTERLHETQAGCEFFKLAVDCRRSESTNELRGLWAGATNTLRGQDIRKLSTAPDNSWLASNKWLLRRYNYFAMMRNSGFNLIYLFDPTPDVPDDSSDGSSELTRKQLVFKDPNGDLVYPVIHKPPQGDPTYENGQITGEGVSDALGRIAKRMMVGATRQMGSIVNPDTGMNVDIAKEFVSRPLGALLDAYFTETFNEGVYGLSAQQITDMKDGDIGSTNTGGVSALKRRKKIDTGNQTVGEETIEQYFLAGQQWLGRVESVSTGVDKFNKMVQKTREFAESSDNISDVINRMANPPDDMDVDDTYQELAKLAKDEEWFDQIDSKVMMLTSTMTAVTTINVVAEVVILGDAGEKDWSFKDSLSIVSQLQGIYETAEAVNGRLVDIDVGRDSVFSHVHMGENPADEFTELSDRGRVLLPKVVGESIGTLADGIDAGICAYRAQQRWEVGDTNSAVAKGTQGVFSMVGVGATMFGIITTGAAPLAAAIAAAAALAAMTVAFFSWLFGIEDKPIEVWMDNSEFGTTTPSDTNSPDEPQFRATHDDRSIRLARQISWYLSIRMGFTVEFEPGVVFAPKVVLREDTTSMEISLENVLRGSYDSNLLICPIKQPENVVQCPSHVVSMGSNDTYDFVPPLTIQKIRRNDAYMTDVALSSAEYDPAWWDESSDSVRTGRNAPRPPSEVWAWNGIFQASDDVADLCAAGESKYGGTPGSGKAAYDNTWGVELIHAFGGLDEDLRTILQNAENAPSDRQKEIARIVELLPFPRQRVGLRWEG